MVLGKLDNYMLKMKLNLSLKVLTEINLKWIKHTLLFSHSVTSDSLLPCPSPSPRVCSNSCRLS